MYAHFSMEHFVIGSKLVDLIGQGDFGFNFQLGLLCHNQPQYVGTYHLSTNEHALS
jgi:hypothetical protein